MKNAFDLLRLVAALMVVYSHSYVLYGMEEPLILNRWSFGAVGVWVFFSISGYLVSQSWHRDPDFWRFLLRRTLRLFPGLIVAVLFSVLLVGRLDYEGLVYFVSNASMISGKATIPGVFESNPVHAINGSLWTLRYEFLMYLILTAALYSTRVCVVITLAFIGAVLTFWITGVNNLDLWLPWKVRLLGLSIDVVQLSLWGTFFLVGACIAILKIRLTPLVAVMLGLALLLAHGRLAAALLLITLPYVILTIATRVSFHLKHDLSYGVYIYAFPVQQFVTMLFLPRAIGWAWALTTSLLLTLGLAYLSWRYVEKPALRLKPRGQLKTA
jgi:peptidoglycan/LPS O-acetylase OafA/YrhL